MIKRPAQVHLVYKANEHDGFSEVVSVHKLENNATNRCVALNLVNNPRMLVARDDYYVQPHTLEN